MRLKHNYGHKHEFMWKVGVAKNPVTSHYFVKKKGNGMLFFQSLKVYREKLASNRLLTIIS